MSIIYTGHKILERKDNNVKLCIIATDNDNIRISFAILYNINENNATVVERVIQLGPNTQHYMIYNESFLNTEKKAKLYGFTLTATRINEIQEYAIKSAVKNFIENNDKT